MPQQSNRYKVNDFKTLLCRKLLFLCPHMTPEREAKITRVLNYRQPDLVMVMENVHDPHNISAVMRTCDAVGVQEVFVLNTAIGRHKKFGKTSSASAAGWLTIHQYDNTEACMEAVRKRVDKIYATHLG